ncbi:CBS domain-containing protein [Pradoshia sp. D12]|uniref:CBS domain-containing protein n=1 Tax=Bacillaceae TaxID=186817 RepID=UPI00112220DB|nr:MULTISPECIES: CBS domain-containing protein [Bacillaceae]QFK72950.1 CBS domain-containing protein [Pradoshia sp. D12]TPF71942.1 CBS domain-containing protein [Bacillus sp. D12]
MKAKDFMIKDVISLNEEASIKTLLEVLMKHKIGGLPLVDPNNKLLGIVTDGDVLRYMNPKAFISSYVTYIEELDETLKSKSESPVKAIMKKKVVFVREEDELEDVLKLLATHHFKKIPVVNGNREVVGVISRGDMIRKLGELLLEKL